MMNIANDDLYSKVSYWKKRIELDPFRLFFPMGIIFLVIGTLLWLPHIWDKDAAYPVLLHRCLVLGGFTTCFITGFLMTAAPKFSQSFPAQSSEIFLMVLTIFVGIVAAINEMSDLVYATTSFQSLILLFFLVRRLIHRKSNPPYSFLMIPIGLLFWMASGILCIFFDDDLFKRLHYEGAIATIIIGVGSRLIPGILGYNQIVTNQRNVYEQKLSLHATIPTHFYMIFVIFWISYFIDFQWGAYLRLFVVSYVGVFYWQLLKIPPIKTALTRCIWFCCWMIWLSFLFSAIWLDGHIHATHKFFVSGIVLLSILVGTRVIQAHGAKDPSLENIKSLYFITASIILAGMTRVTAILWPDIYFSHLGYSSFFLNLGILWWSFIFLRYVKKV